MDIIVGAEQGKTFVTPEVGPHELEKLAHSQLEHALDARRRGLKIYESLKSLNEVIGTQYGDRVLFELLQNAHDAHGLGDRGEISVRLIVESDERGELFVANRGRGFTYSNLDSIRNIGTSDKEIGEGIGNKGLGFRSVEALTEDVRIYSQEESGCSDRFKGYCFRFATIEEIEARLEPFGAPGAIRKEVAGNIPRYLVPLPLDDQPDEIMRFAQAGFATVVALPLRSADAVQLAYKQVLALASPDAPVLLFLDRIGAIDIEIRQRGEPPVHKHLTRSASEIADAPALSGVTLQRVELGEGRPLLVARRVLPKDEVLEAVRESIPVAPTLKRWLEWKGEAIVSVAVPLERGSVISPRLFNFLPMDEKATAPVAGYIDAPFFADIDRRSMKPDLPLNRYFLKAAGKTCAAAALAIVENGLHVPKESVVDLVAWTPPHIEKIVAGFAALERSFTSAKIWPIVPGGESRWAELDRLYAWPEVTTKFLNPGRLAATLNAAILPATLGEERLSRVRVLAAAVSKPVTLTSSVLCIWATKMAEALAQAKRWHPNRWRNLYEDVVTFSSAGALQLKELEGKPFVISSERRLLAATATGNAEAPPVFVRAKSSRGRRTDGPPLPPNALSKRLRFLHDGVRLGEETRRALEKAGLVQRYDPVEILRHLEGALGAKPTLMQREQALIWAFRVWRTAGGSAVEEALRSANLFVPTFSGWTPAKEAFFSETWTNTGKLLESFLREAAGPSVDCANQRDRLLIPFSAWPVISSEDRKCDWRRFLEVVAVHDGLQPIAGNLQRQGTPNSFWRQLFSNGNVSLGLSAAWIAVARDTRLAYPYTDYVLEGECWRLPGQLEHNELPQPAKECLSELIIGHLRECADKHFRFTVRHWRSGGERVQLPTPLQIFLREGEWVMTLRRDEVLLRKPSQSWWTQVARQPPPRFVERLAAEPGHHGTVPTLLFDPRIGLRDWSKPETAPERLAALARSLSDLSAAERRDLRDQLRRAWSDIAEGALTLPDSLTLVVERSAGLDVCEPDKMAPPVVHVTSERQGFAARALVDQDQAVLDVGETNARAIQELLQRTGGFSPHLADAGDVRLLVDGVDFQPSGSNPVLVSGELEWLSDAAMLAHEFLGDPLELRNLSSELLEQRIRLIRIKRCQEFALLVGDHKVSAPGSERVHPFPHARLPTLLVSGSEPIDLDLLTEAAPALTKLMGARRGTLEMMLARLARHGFQGSGEKPTDQQYARAIRREVQIVHDHFAATRGGIERRVRALLPILSYLKGLDVARRLSERHTQLGPSFKLREWMTEELGDELTDELWLVVDETEDQVKLRRALGFDFPRYAAILAELGYPPLNDEQEFRRLFEAYLNDLRTGLVNRVRRRYRSVYERGEDLADYLGRKTLDFVAFDPSWPLTMEELDRAFVETYVSEAAEAALGPDDRSIELPDLTTVSLANQKMVVANQPRMATVVRAWCQKKGRDYPGLMDPANPQPLVRALDKAGLFDFERLDAQKLPCLCDKVGAWPTGMAQTLFLDALELTESDLDIEEHKAREERVQAEVSKRTIIFSRRALDTGASDFERIFSELADSALVSGSDWYARSRPPRLIIQEQQGGEKHRGGGGHGSGKGQGWRDQPPETIRRAMGIVSEYLAREYLKRRHPREMSDQCWVSSNRAAFCLGESGDDGLGYDFRVVTARNEWLYEVKSALDEGGEFELTARELEVAASAALDRKRRYRILYVPYVFDPDRWRVLPLQNPAGQRTRNRFRVIRTGSVRYAFGKR